jgi:riboflavin synthase
MFTGIVEELGTLLRRDELRDAARLVVHAPLCSTDAVPGASIAVNGVCLTVVEIDGDAAAFSADVMAETLHRSSLGALHAGSAVNLERAMPADGRFGGHVVQGHVDGTGRILARHLSEHWEVVRCSLPAALARYVVQKGSIAVDGVSLTVSAVSEAAPDAEGSGTAAAGDAAPQQWFEVSLIPTTLAATTLGSLPVGAVVNLEVDVLAKYVERQVQHQLHDGVGRLVAEGVR